MYAKGNVSKKLLLLMVEKEKEDTTSTPVMKTNNNKLKGKLQEIETQNSTDDFDYFPKDPTNSPSEEKNKRKRKERDIMQLESTKEGVSSKSRTLESEDKQIPEQVRSDNSKKSRSAAPARKRTRYTDLYEDDEAQISVRNRAAKLLERLEKETKLPSFVKCMLPSNVSQGFWLHLPKDFCTSNLPNHDSSIVLVDELGNEHTTSYLLGRHGLSAGWRKFSLTHKLLKGDLLIFLLTGPCKFKVHIVRVNDLEVILAALCLMRMVTSWIGTDADPGKKNKRKRKRNRYMDPLLFDFLKPSENVEGRNTPKSSISGPSVDQSSSSNSYGFSSEVIEGSENTDQSETEESSYTETSFFG